MNPEKDIPQKKFKQNYQGGTSKKNMPDLLTLYETIIDKTRLRDAKICISVVCAPISIRKYWNGIKY